MGFKFIITKIAHVKFSFSKKITFFILRDHFGWRFFNRNVCVDIKILICVYLKLFVKLNYTSITHWFKFSLCWIPFHLPNEFNLHGLLHFKIETLNPYNNHHFCLDSFRSVYFWSWPRLKFMICHIYNVVV